MSIFLFLLIIVAISSYLELFSRIDKKSRIVILSTLLFIYYCLSFLRWEYGLDWEGYYRMFQIFNWGEDTEGHELLFSYIIIIGKSFINSYTFVLFLFSTILFYCQYKGIIKLSIFPLTSLFILAGTYSCNVGYVRQYIAVAITFLSIIYIVQRRLVPFMICVIIAFGIHYSALAFLPAYWFFNVRISRKRIIILLIVSLFLSSIMSSFLQEFGNIIGIAGIVDRADGYIDQGYDYDDGGPLSAYQVVIKALINRSLIILIGLFLMGKVNKSDSYFIGLFNLYCFGSIFFFMTSPIHVALTRMSWYYDFTQILIIPSVFLYIKNKDIKLMTFLLIAVFMFVKLYLSENLSDNEMFTKYKFIPEIENLFF